MYKINIKLQRFVITVTQFWQVPGLGPVSGYIMCCLCVQTSESIMCGQSGSSPIGVGRCVLLNLYNFNLNNWHWTSWIDILVLVLLCIRDSLTMAPGLAIWKSFKTYVVFNPTAAFVGEGDCKNKTQNGYYQIFTSS